MPMENVDTLDDPRLHFYRNLKDGELAREGDRFIVEGDFVVQRALASDFPVESVLVAQRKLAEMRPLIPENLPLYVAPDSMMNHIVGFQFHTGVIAVARRKPQLPLDQLLQQATTGGKETTFVILPETTSLQNMGAMVRIAAAFGASGVIVGQHSVDPFYRLPVRVSMGNCFRLPIYRSTDLARDLQLLKTTGQVQMMATVLDTDAIPLAQMQRPLRLGLLFGSEGYGLHRQWIDLCDHKVTIPMQLGTDSLNVAVSAGVFLYHFTSLAHSLH